MLYTKFFFILLLTLNINADEDDGKVFKICSSSSLNLFELCKDFLGQYIGHGDDTQIDCVPARDRIECLEMIKRNEADVVIVEPEDVYIAKQLDNDKFRIIAEFRYNENDAFQDEDQILIKKSSTIQSLKDLKGLKSCHPSFNSYYGYKIPVVILKRHGLLEVSKDSSIPALERELKALSEFFEQSCIVGPYSEDEKLDQEWKKKYSNLCQLCQNPIDCDSNDKYYSYDGAIKCLVNNEGDVAFTSRNAIRKYFGVTDEDSNEHVDINDYELLCKVGSRQAINGTGCSLSKKPNIAFITTTNITDNPDLLISLQLHLETFFKNGLEYGNSDLADDLLIDREMTLHLNTDVIAPKDYIVEFIDHIDRDESYTYKVKLCVTTEIELEKCKVLAKVAFARDIRPEIECYLSEGNDCAADVANDEAHIAIIPLYNWTKVEEEFSNLKPIAYENLNFDYLYIAIFNGANNLKEVLKFPIKFDYTDKKALKAACLLHLVLGNEDCENLHGNVEDENYIEVIRIHERHNYGRDKVLLCLDETRSHIGDFFFCNLDIYYQNAIYVNENKSQAIIDSYKNVIATIGDTFGSQGYYNVFDLFSPFKGHNDVLFNDLTLDLNGVRNTYNVTEKSYNFLKRAKDFEWSDDESSTEPAADVDDEYVHHSDNSDEDY